MAKTNKPTPDTAPINPAQTPPAQGGSYTLDEQTGAHTLVERTEHANRTMKKES